MTATRRGALFSKLGSSAQAAPFLSASLQGRRGLGRAGGWHPLAQPRGLLLCSGRGPLELRVARGLVIVISARWLASPTKRNQGKSEPWRLLRHLGAPVVSHGEHRQDSEASTCRLTGELSSAFAFALMVSDARPGNQSDLHCF